MMDNLLFVLGAAETIVLVAACVYWTISEARTTQRRAWIDHSSPPPPPPAGASLPCVSTDAQHPK